MRLATALTPLFCTVRIHHLRVPLGRSAQTGVTVTAPHAQRPRGFALSCLKLLYMLAQSWLAHLRVLAWRRRGQLVIVDRYFLDYAIDPQRYRMPASTVRLASLLGKLAPRPDVQFVLDVRGEELQRRKHEVSLSESRRQRAEYAARIGRLPNAVLLNAGRPVDTVTAEIIATLARFVNYRSTGPASAMSRAIQDALR